LCTANKECDFKTRNNDFRRRNNNNKNVIAVTLLQFDQTLSDKLYAFATRNPHFHDNFLSRHVL